MRESLITLIALVMTVPCAANAAAIYENPWNSVAGDAGAFSQADQRLAGEFTLAAGASADRATWYGTMLSPDPLNTGDTWSFLLTFYNTSGGLPGGVLASAAVTASVTDTGVDITGERAYLFDATFSSVALSAGMSYWFSTENTGTQDTFRWTEATAGLTSAISQFGDPWTLSLEETRTPFNFKLFGGAGAVPGPATVALLGIGLTGLGFGRRKPSS